MEKVGLRDSKRVWQSLAVIVLLSMVATACYRKSTVVQQTQTSAAPFNTPSPSAYPTPEGFINDFANVFDESGRQKLELAVAELKRDLDVEFGVATIETTNGVPIFDYSLALAREWKPGGQSGRGVLLVLAIKDHNWRLQVSKALEKELPDELCKQLGDQSVELYKAGKYAEGVEKYIKAIAEKLKAQPKSVASAKGPMQLAKRANESIADRQVA